MEYQRRIADAELDTLMGDLPALALEGARGVGKTATAARRADTVFELDDPGQREVLIADPSMIDVADGTVLIDEWQRHPPIWDVVRRRVDAGAPPGRFLLTGSAEPTEEPAHSGAGRIVRVRMRPLSLAERGLAEPAVGLGAMLAGERPAISGNSDMACATTSRRSWRRGSPVSGRWRSEHGAPRSRATSPVWSNAISPSRACGCAVPPRCTPGCPRTPRPPRRQPVTTHSSMQPRPGRPPNPPRPRRPRIETSSPSCGCSTRSLDGYRTGTTCAGSPKPQSTTSPTPLWPPTSSASTPVPSCGARAPGPISPATGRSSGRCSSRS